MSSSRLNMLLAAAMLAAAFALLPASANAATSGGATSGSSGARTGGVSPNDPEFRPTGKAKLVAGKAIPPADAPPEVVNAINAANKIVGKPYKYGGGHGRWNDSGYDCSGAMSYALHGAGLLDRPLTSGDFMSWGSRGKGSWITIYANSGHGFLVIAGLRFDTGWNNAGKGPRWSEEMRPAGGYTVRHPRSL
jgi:cell wall-associated NlpC family hydrolase